MRRFLVYFILANIIAAVFLWLAARELPFDQVGAYFAQADVKNLALWSAIFCVSYLICHGARVFRWNELVRPLGDDLDPWVVHRVSAVGFFAILLLPLRLGELVRPYLLSRRSNLSISSLLGTAVVERVIDGLIITGLLFVTLAFYDGNQQTDAARYLGIIAACIFIPALIVCLLAFWRRDWTVSVVRRIGSLVSVKIADKLAGMLDAFILGFRGLVAGRSAGRFMVFTVVYWTSNAVSMWLLVRFAFGLDIGFFDAFALLAILVIGIMIPAGPGLAGNFEFFVGQGLSVFVDIEQADIGVRVAAYAATLHVLQFFVITIPGLIVMWSDPEARHLIRLSEQAGAEEE